MITYFDHPHTGSMTEITERLGGKGASLWAMTTQLGLPVPPGFTIGTEHASAGLTETLFDAVREGVDGIGAKLGRRFGDCTAPLLLSVRSGATVSMPGMMDTLLNVGITSHTASGLGNSDFAIGTLAAFRAQFAATVPDHNPAILDDPHAILRMAIEQVLASWHSPRAQAYRARAGLSHLGGTAVTVQAMVFGNRDARSGTGVAFSRNPSTGARVAQGDWLPQAQGEAVVAGTHDTQPLEMLASFDRQSYDTLMTVLGTLERYYRDMVDVEFTIESGQLWILQARAGKRSAAAAARIACDLVADPVIALGRAEALARLPASLFDGSEPISERSGGGVEIAQGLGVSPRLVSGRAAFDCDAAIAMADDGDPVILIRSETSPEDVHGMGVSAGIVTATGGMMSHAALVAREWGIAAVCGANIRIDQASFRAGSHLVLSGDMISIDGTTGKIFKGRVAGTALYDPYIAEVQRWANGNQTTTEMDYGQA